MCHCFLCASFSIFSFAKFHLCICTTMHYTARWIIQEGLLFSMTTLGAKIDEDFFFLCHIPSVCAFRVFWVHSLIMRLWGAVAISLKLILTSFSPFFGTKKKKEGGGVSWLAIWRVLQWNDIRNRWFDFAGIIHPWFNFPKTASRDVIKVWGDFYEKVVRNFNCYLTFLFCGLMPWVLLKWVIAPFCILYFSF